MNPYLHPRRAEPLISFLKRAFGAEEVAKYASPDGVVHHAVVRVGDSVLEMGEAHGTYEPMEAMFYLYVPNMETLYRQALAAGATTFQEPTVQPYGDRNARQGPVREQMVHRNSHQGRGDVIGSEHFEHCIGPPSKCWFGRPYVCALQTAARRRETPRHREGGKCQSARANIRVHLAGHEARAIASRSRSQNLLFVIMIGVRTPIRADQLDY